MAVVFNHLAGLQDTNFDSPDSLCLVPCRLADAVLQLDVPIELILAGDPLEILQNLVPWRIAKLFNDTT